MIQGSLHQDHQKKRTIHILFNDRCTDNRIQGISRLKNNSCFPGGASRCPDHSDQAYCLHKVCQPGTKIKDANALGELQSEENLKMSEVGTTSSKLLIKQHFISYLCQLKLIYSI